MTIFRKNIIILGLAALGLSIVLVISSLAAINHQYVKTNSNALLHTAKILIAAVGEDRIGEYFSGRGQSVDDDLNNCLAAIRGTGDYRLSLIEPGGEVLWDSIIEENFVNHINRSEIQAALDGKEGLARRKSVSTGIPRIYVTLPVYTNSADGAVICGVFRLSVAVPGFWRRVAPAALPFLICAVLFALAAFAAAIAFSRSLSGSLARLVDSAETAAGEGYFRDKLSHIPVPGEAEEFYALKSALQSMVEELDRRSVQLEAEGRQLLAILNRMSEAVLAVDNNLNLYLANPRACSLFGIDEKGASLLEATRSTELEKAALTALAEGSAVEMELKMRGSGGEARAEQLFQVFVTPLSTPAEEQRGVIIVMENITRMARLEQMRKDFVANVSHELRTPIQLIKGFSETLIDAPVNDKEQFRRCIEIINKNAVTMENLTNDLLTLASLEDNAIGNSVMREQPLAPLFTEAALSVEPQAKKKEITINIDCADDLTAAVHGPLIIQALINLLDNGIKYSSKKSRIWMSAYTHNGGLVLEVKDEGMGIPGEHLERIFERFYRVDRSHSRSSPSSESGGTGLGLSIVRHIALLHHGTAEVESHAGEGSVFRIRL